MPLYHFTDESNVRSILEHGLLSWPELKKRKISNRPNSNALSRKLDVQKGLQNYVRLALSPDHPMAYRVLKEKRINKVVWLEVSDEITNMPDVLFSDTNATANRARVDRKRSTAFRSRDRQAEVLIRAVAPKYITLFEAGTNQKWTAFWNRVVLWFRRLSRR